MDILQTITNEFNLTLTHAQNIIALLDEGNTVPFIARYRKEMTGACDDQVLRALNDRLTYLRNLEKRKEEVENAKLQQQPTKISSQQLDILLKLLVDKGITDEAVQKTMEVYKVNDLSELNETQYGQILRRLKGE
jgi:transcriptional accessory protein Tex/SPT6